MGAIVNCRNNETATWLSVSSGSCRTPTAQTEGETLLAPMIAKRCSQAVTTMALSPVIPKSRAIKIIAPGDSSICCT